MSRLELCVMLYQRERDDERAFWSSSASILVGSLVLVAGLAGIVVDRGSWIVLAMPVFGIPIFGLYLNQAAVGSRRRIYMALLENAIQTELNERISFKKDLLPAISYSAYTWPLATTEKFVPRLSRASFAITNAGAIVVAFMLAFTPFFYTAHEWVGVVFGVLWSLTYLLLLLSGARTVNNPTLNEIARAANKSTKLSRAGVKAAEERCSQFPSILSYKEAPSDALGAALIESSVDEELS